MDRHIEKKHSDKAALKGAQAIPAPSAATAAAAIAAAAAAAGPKLKVPKPAYMGAGPVIRGGSEIFR